MIRSQRYLDLALGHVAAVRDATQPEDERRRIYGGLCHAFPVMVRTNGLCQALAFVVAKKSAPTGTAPKPRHQAYQDLYGNVRETLDIDGDPLQAVREADLMTYTRHTRTVLDAWVYYSRFAESVLEVPKGERDETAS